MLPEIDSPTVSIILPVYNKEAWIELTLRTIVNQSFKNWECVIVDDGSTDDSREIIKNFIEWEPGNWKFISQENAGQSAARNKAISQSQGDYICFLDADDIWARNKIECQLEVFAKFPDTALVLCPFISFKRRSSRFSLNFFRHYDSQKLLRGWLNMRGYGGGTESVGMVSRRALEATGGFDRSASTSSGLLLTLQLSKIGPIRFANKTLMGYRQYDGQWHQDQIELNRNMRRITDIYCADKINEHERNSMSQDAYFFLTSRGKITDVFDYKGVGAKIDGFRLVALMALALISRRILSTFRGMLFKNYRILSKNDFEDFLRQIRS